MKHFFSGRPHGKLLVAAAAVLCSAVGAAMPAGTASAASTQPHKPPANTITATIKMDRVSALPNALPSLTVPCGPKFDDFDRTQLCWGETLTFTFKKKMVPVGTLTAELIQYISLNPRSDVWTEHDTVTKTVATGTTALVNVDLVADCDSPCEATALLSGVLVSGLSGTVVYIDTIDKGHDHTTPTYYVLDYEAPDYIPENVLGWTSPGRYRCDQGIAEKGTGCVFPEFTPTLGLSVRQAGASAALFKWAQDHMSAHWGLKGKGSPLTRASGDAGDDNRGIVCDRTFKRQGTVVVKGGEDDVDSCDEFPLASTKQSGAATLLKEKKTGAACAQLQSVRTADSGTEAEQWGNVKVIGKPDYAAPCVRGHVPNKLNGSTGGSYIKFASNQRLFVGENFWVSVGP